MDYPSNSRTGKTEASEEDRKEASAEEKNIKRVTQGEVVRRKKSLGKRFRETFVGGDAKGVWGYVVLDVLIPAAKDMVADAMSTGVERMLFGEVRSSSRRGGSRRGGSPYGHVAYNRMSSSNGPPWDREPRREFSRRARSSHDFDEIILETRGEAEEVIDRLFDLVSRYEVATVEDLYELVGITGNYTDRKWGWTDIRGAGVSRVRNGFLIDLPRPEPLD